MNLNDRKLSLGEVAAMAGVTEKTLRNYAARHRAELWLPRQPERLARRGVVHPLENRAVLRLLIVAPLAEHIAVARAVRAAVVATDGAHGPAVEDALLVVRGDTPKRIAPDEIPDEILAARAEALTVLDLRPIVAALAAELAR